MIKTKQFVSRSLLLSGPVATVLLAAGPASIQAAEAPTNSWIDPLPDFPRNAPIIIQSVPGGRLTCTQDGSYAFWQPISGRGYVMRWPGPSGMEVGGVVKMGNSTAEVEHYTALNSNSSNPFFEIVKKKWA